MKGLLTDFFPVCATSDMVNWAASQNLCNDCTATKPTHEDKPQQTEGRPKKILE